MKLRNMLLVGVLMAFCSAAVPAAEDPALAEGDDLAVQLKIAHTIAPSLVQVEYTLRYDKGEPPPRGARTIQEERPMEQSGFLISPSEVVTSDVRMHPRFIKAIAVRFGDRSVEAQPVGWALTQNACFLKLAKPLGETTPLKFTPDAEGPYYAVTYGKRNGAWNTNVQSMLTRVNVRTGGSAFVAVGWHSLIVDEEGSPVGLCMRDELPADDSWKGSPEKWAIVSQEKMDELLQMVRHVSRRGILHVALNFRSPKKSSRDDGEVRTELHVPGLLIADKKILVLAELKPKLTARLDRITVHIPNGDEMTTREAKFESTLSDYGCFLASLEEPTEGVISMSSEEILGFRHKALLAAVVRMKGENRIEYLSHKRIFNFRTGWRGNLYPSLTDEGEDSFLFDEKARLIAFPVTRRRKVSAERQRRSNQRLSTAATNFMKVFTDLPKNIDPSNIPLIEKEENRLAWLGVELQPLNKELARANNVSDLSRDGEIGAVVSYVYPDSPAARGGIEIGFILLRLHVEGYPKPLEVKLEQSRWGGRAFPWDRLDEIPEQYYDQIPRPWPSAENTASRALTDLGFGKKFRAEFFSDGNVIYKDSVVVQSPQHYDSAKKYKSETLGITVKNLTYEVRRYFHKKDDDPGVIAGRIEPGSKASVSGIKPYEIITHVDGIPIISVDDFEKLIAEKTELRLSVKRMTKGRVVLIKLKSATTQDASERKGSTTQEVE